MQLDDKGGEDLILMHIVRLLHSDTDSPLPLPTTPQPWLVRIPEIFEGIAEDILRRFGAQGCTRLGQDFYSIKTTTPGLIQDSEAAKFARWNLPLEHSWPCNPQKMDGFKFSAKAPANGWARPFVPSLKFSLRRRRIRSAFGD